MNPVGTKGKGRLNMLDATREVLEKIRLGEDSYEGLRLRHAFRNKSLTVVNCRIPVNLPGPTTVLVAFMNQPEQGVPVIHENGEPLSRRRSESGHERRRTATDNRAADPLRAEV